MVMRLFVAVPISENLQNEILEWEKSHQNLPVRWLKGKNLHITLIPPWEEENIEKIRATLKTFENKIGRFGIEFDKMEYGPHGREPRLIWAEGKPPKILLDLKGKLELLLGRKSDFRPWLMHLTLARFRPETFSSFTVKRLNEKVYWPEQVNSIVLMESHLLPDGSDYEVLERVFLK